MDIAVRCRDDPRTFINTIRIAEVVGFQSIWLVEISDVDTIAFTSALSHVTDKIRMCTDLANSSLRLPTIHAMCAATVSNLLHGRFILCIGTGSSLTKNSDTINAKLARLRENTSSSPPNLVG